MKILLYSYDWAPSIGGVQTVTMSLARGLVEWREDAAGPAPQVTVVTATPADGMDDSSLPFRVVRRPGVIKLAQLLRNADLVHLAGPSLLPLFLSRLLRKKVVVEHHGYYTACPNSLLLYLPSQSICPGHFLARRYLECLRCNATDVGWAKSLRLLLGTFPRRWLCRRVEANVVPSRHVGVRIALPETRTIYHGVPYVTDTCSQAERASGKPVTFVFVGRLVHGKGVDLLLQAAKQLADCCSAFCLKIIGDGPERTRLEALTSSLGLADRVTFAGSLEGAQLESSLRNAAGAIVPSISEEAAGLVAMEQMMRGQLVIAADLGGLGEVVNGAGLKFTPGDAVELAARMKQALEQPQRSSELRLAARERALAQFPEEKMVRAHLELYRQLLIAAGAGGEAQTQR